MPKALRVLLVEDDLVSADMMESLLRRGGLNPVFTRVTARESFLEELRSQSHDIILCDYHLPAFGAPEALEILRSSRIDIPCIVISGTVGEETAVELLKKGAADFVAKDKPLRLVPAVERELREADMRRRKRAVEEGLRQSESQFRTLFESTRDAIMMLDEKGFFDCNQATLDVFRCATRQQFIARHPSELSPPNQPDGRNSLTAATERIGTAFREGEQRFEWMHRRADGADFPAEVLLSRMELHGRTVLQATVRDITERKRAEQAMTESESRFRTLFESSWDAIMTLAPPTWEFTSANPATVRLFAAASETQFMALGLWNVSPERQPDGTLSSIKAPEMIMRAMKDGSNFFEWTHQRLNGETFPATVLLTRMEIAGVTQLQATVRDITREKEAHAELVKLMRAVEQSPACIVITDPEGLIEYVNPRFTTLTGYSMEEAMGKNPRILKSGEMSPAAYQELWAAIKAGREWHGEFHNRKKNGDLYWELASISPVLDELGHVTHFVAVKEDITERKRLEIELAQARKLESVGQLAAGIAHEINTPTQFVGDNTRFLKDSFAAIVSLLEKYRALQSAVAKTGVEPALSLEVDRAAKEGDLEYLLTEVPKAIDQSLEGIQRISKIVRAMKEFSHPGAGEKELTDINRAIETTVTVARNEWKYVADLEMNLDPGLPPVSCLVGEINQALLNLIVNAAHAIEATGVKESGVKGLIRIATRQDGDGVEVRVSDTGTGIAEEHRKKIFEPFFTTKAVGKGTGQGLMIVYQTVVKKHGGTIRFETEAGKGTTFAIRIPTGGVAGSRGIS